jgi:hypothetical protein
MRIPKKGTYEAILGPPVQRWCHRSQKKDYNNLFVYITLPTYEDMFLYTEVAQMEILSAHDLEGIVIHHGNLRVVLIKLLLQVPAYVTTCPGGPSSYSLWSMNQ